MAVDAIGEFPAHHPLVGHFPLPQQVQVVDLQHLPEQLQLLLQVVRVVGTFADGAVAAPQSCAP
jgi:hypothetical protein